VRLLKLAGWQGLRAILLDFFFLDRIYRDSVQQVWLQVEVQIWRDMAKDEVDLW